MVGRDGVGDYDASSPLASEQRGEPSLERSRRDAGTVPPWHFLTAIIGFEKGDHLTITGDIPGALRAFAEATTDLEQAYRRLTPQDWPSPGWPWRAPLAKAVSNAINAASAADKAEAKRVGAAAVDLLLRFRQRDLPAPDAAACNALKALTQ